MKKFKLTTKSTSSKWRTFAFATEFDNGGMVVNITQKGLDALQEAIAAGEVVFDKYGSIQLRMFEDTPYDGTKDQQTHVKQKSNAYVSEPIMESDMPF